MKYYEYKIHSYEMNIFFKAIREKVDTISILMAAIKSMLIQIPQDNINNDNKMVLCIDKMSRLFFISEKKIYTITFPFSAIQQENRHLIFNSDLFGTIDSQVATSIQNIANSTHEIELIDLGIMIEENGIEYLNLWALYKFLMMNEDGYIRFDHDTENANGLVHPINHFDIFYSNKSTFKLGLNKIPSLVMFMDMLDKNTDCHFLNNSKTLNLWGSRIADILKH
jgi:hypothetical protein